jgi:hypothetical protein
MDMHDREEAYWFAKIWVTTVAPLPIFLGHPDAYWFPGFLQRHCSSFRPTRLGEEISRCMDVLRQTCHTRAGGHPGVWACFCKHVIHTQSGIQVHERAPASMSYPRRRVSNH